MLNPEVKSCKGRYILASCSKIRFVWIDNWSTMSADWTPSDTGSPSGDPSYIHNVGVSNCESHTQITQQPLYTHQQNCTS